jgi:hypothetical protein
LRPFSEDRYLLQVTVSSELREKLELARDLASHSNRDGMASVIEVAVDLLLDRLKARRFGLKRETRRPQRKPEGADIRRGTRPADTGAQVPEAPQSERTEPPAAEAELDDHSRQGSECSEAENQTTHGDRCSEPADHAAHDGGCPEQADRAAPNDRRTTRDHIPNRVRREVTERDGLRCTFIGKHGTRCTGRAFLQLDHEQAWAHAGGDEPGSLRLLCASHNRLRAELEFGRQHVQRAIAKKRKSYRNK